MSVPGPCVTVPEGPGEAGMFIDTCHTERSQGKAGEVQQLEAVAVLPPGKHSAETETFATSLTHQYDVIDIICIAAAPRILRRSQSPFCKALYK